MGADVTGGPPSAVVQHRLRYRTDRDAAAFGDRRGCWARRFGVELTDHEEPFSQSNDVWLVDAIALHVSREPGDRRYFNEAWLAAHLPAAVGYTHPLSDPAGSTGIRGWRASGSPASAWPRRGPASPRPSAAMRSAPRGQRLEAVHGVTIPGWEPPASPFYASSARRRARRIDHLEAIGAIPATCASDARRAVAAFALALAQAAPPAVCHTDAHPGNVLWHDGEVVAILDFEFATLARPTWTSTPCSGSRPVSSSARRPSVRPRWRPGSWPGRRDSALHGYTVLREVWALATWCRFNPWTPETVAQWRPRLDLERLIGEAPGCG